VKRHEILSAVVPDESNIPDFSKRTSRQTKLSLPRKCRTNGRRQRHRDADLWRSSTAGGGDGGDGSAIAQRAAGDVRKMPAEGDRVTQPLQQVRPKEEIE
jgi:hypothetical protein